MAASSQEGVHSHSQGEDTRLYVISVLEPGEKLLKHLPKGIKQKHLWTKVIKIKNNFFWMQQIFFWKDTSLKQSQYQGYLNNHSTKNIWNALPRDNLSMFQTK